MYLFVFAWVPALQEVTPTSTPNQPVAPLPLGYIFSAFMVSMMLGSVFYSAVSASSSSTPTSPSQSKLGLGDSTLTLHAKLSSLVCTAGALALAASVSTSDVRVRFWAFCLFEACVGVYYPVQGMLRSSLVSNDHRATVRPYFLSLQMYSMSRVRPLFSSRRCSAFLSISSSSLRS